MASKSASSSGAVADADLTWVDQTGNEYHYAKNPMTHAALFILLQELCERLAFYGLTPNLQEFLTEYMGYAEHQADSYISIFNGLIYATPLLSAIIADSFLGMYWTILIFSCLYMLGLLILVLATLQSIFEPWMVHVSLLVLISLGAGGIKSCVNVFGAQQFHPVFHAEELTRYFTFFYAAINVGALVGGIACPTLQSEVSWFASFSVPFVAFVIATIVYVIGTPRYVRMKAQGSVVLRVLKLLVESTRTCGFSKQAVSNGGPYPDDFVADAKQVLWLFPLFALIIPFNVAYGQMTTTFLTQGKKMDRDLFGWDMPAALMQNVDAIGVIFWSLVVESFLYPTLRRHSIMPHPLRRFALGSFCGCLSLMCAYFVELAVSHADTLNSISIWCQIPQYLMIALGEIFLISTSYELAFEESPAPLKAVASGVNLLFFAAANFISAALFNLCSDWLVNFDEDERETWHQPGGDVHYNYFFLLLVGICFLGILAALLASPYYVKLRKARIQRMELAASAVEGGK